MNELPAKLYKYERIDAQTLRNLKAQSIYFGSPKGFNDPYDCAITPNIRQLTIEEVEEVRAYYLQDRELTDQQRTELENLSAAKLSELMHRQAAMALLGAVFGKDTTDLIMAPFCTKSDSWSYECEWRALHNQVGTSYGYVAGALTGVYFGPDIESEMMEIVCLILKGQNDNFALYEGQRSTAEFKVGFRKFTYTDYLTAKKMGLRK